MPASMGMGEGERWGRVVVVQKSQCELAELSLGVAAAACGVDRRWFLHRLIMERRRGRVALFGSLGLLVRLSVRDFSARGAKTWPDPARLARTVEDNLDKRGGNASQSCLSSLLLAGRWPRDLIHARASTSVTVTEPMLRCPSL